MLAYEHAIVRPNDLSRVNRAFFTANGVIGIGLFGFALADLIVHGLRGMSALGPRAVGGRGVRRVRARRTPGRCSPACSTPGEPVDLSSRRAARLTLLDETGIVLPGRPLERGPGGWLGRDLTAVR